MPAGPGAPLQDCPRCRKALRRWSSATTSIPRTRLTKSPGPEEGQLPGKSREVPGRGSGKGRPNRTPHWQWVPGSSREHPAQSLRLQEETPSHHHTQDLNCSTAQGKEYSHPITAPPSPSVPQPRGPAWGPGIGGADWPTLGCDL